MTEIVLKAECEWGYSKCVRNHICKTSGEVIMTEMLELDPEGAHGLSHVVRGFYICPHLKLKATLEE
jgi:hypothetical protein